MKTRLLVLILLCGPLALRAADGVDLFDAGLKAFRTNGTDALFSTWYNAAGEAAKIAEVRSRFAKITQDLGPAIDTQVFAPRDLGRHVQKLYGVIYFERRPLWVRAEFYEIGARRGLISLEFSLLADDILPLTWASSGN